MFSFPTAASLASLTSYAQPSPRILVSGGQLPFAISAVPISVHLGVSLPGGSPSASPDCHVQSQILFCQLSVAPIFISVNGVTIMPSTNSSPLLVHTSSSCKECIQWCHCHQHHNQDGKHFCHSRNSSSAPWWSNPVLRAWTLLVCFLSLSFCLF